MLSITELQDFLEKNNADFEILSHEKPIISTQDAALYFDIKKATPVFVIDTENITVAFIVSSLRRKINFKDIGKTLGYSKFKLTKAEKIKETTGYEVGSIPLIGHNLPCIFDKMLLDHDYIYGGTGDAYHTVKISPTDVVRLNSIMGYVE